MNYIAIATRAPSEISSCILTYANHIPIRNMEWCQPFKSRVKDGRQEGTMSGGAGAKSQGTMLIFNFTLPGFLCIHGELILYAASTDSHPEHKPFVVCLE